MQKTHHDYCVGRRFSINLDSVQRLPVDGIPDTTPNFELTSSNKANERALTEHNFADSVCDNPSKLFIPCMQQLQTEEEDQVLQITTH